MNILYFLVPIALLLAAAGVIAFWWSVRSGQYDDVQTPAIRMLLDEETVHEPSEHKPPINDKPERPPLPEH